MQLHTTTLTQSTTNNMLPYIICILTLHALSSLCLSPTTALTSLPPPPPSLINDALVYSGDSVHETQIHIANAATVPLRLHPGQSLPVAVRAFCAVHDIPLQRSASLTTRLLNHLGWSDNAAATNYTEPIQQQQHNLPSQHQHLQHLLPMMRDLAAAGDQMTFRQYSTIAAVVSACAPCNVLIWGAGNDTPLWTQANSAAAPNASTTSTQVDAASTSTQAASSQGTTLVLENSQQWLHKVAPTAPQATYAVVDFHTALPNAEPILRAYSEQGPAAAHSALGVDGLPAWIWDTAWDVIIVDAPAGYDMGAVQEGGTVVRQPHPGRMASIFWTRLLAAAAGTGHDRVDVFVHDVDRHVEALYADVFLGPSYAVIDGNLRHYELQRHAAYRAV